MSTRLSETIASLHETQSVDLENANIDDEGASALADALKENTSVMHFVTTKSATRVLRRLLTH
jgi:hypothetical protein